MHRACARDLASRINLVKVAEETDQTAVGPDEQVDVPADGAVLADDAVAQTRIQAEQRLERGAEGGGGAGQLHRLASGGEDAERAGPRDQPAPAFHC